MRLIIAGSVAAAFATLAAPVLAGDPSCMWNALPAQQRQTATAAIQANGPAALTSNLFDRQALGQSALACRVNMQQAQTAGMALGAYALERATAQQLERDYRVPPARLEAVWNSAPAADRQALVDWAGRQGPGTDPAMQTVIRMVIGLNLPGTRDPNFRNTPQARAALGFFIGRAMRIAMSSRY